MRRRRAARSASRSASRRSTSRRSVRSTSVPTARSAAPAASRSTTRPRDSTQRYSPSAARRRNSCSYSGRRPSRWPVRAVSIGCRSSGWTRPRQVAVLSGPVGLGVAQPGLPLRRVDDLLVEHVEVPHAEAGVAFRQAPALLEFLQVLLHRLSGARGRSPDIGGRGSALYRPTCKVRTKAGVRSGATAGLERGRERVRPDGAGCRRAARRQRRGRCGAPAGRYRPQPRLRRERGGAASGARSRSGHRTGAPGPAVACRLRAQWWTFGPPVPVSPRRAARCPAVRGATSAGCPARPLSLADRPRCRSGCGGCAPAAPASAAGSSARRARSRRAPGRGRARRAAARCAGSGPSRAP